MILIVDCTPDYTPTAKHMDSCCRMIPVVGPHVQLVEKNVTMHLRALVDKNVTMHLRADW